jgi:cytochrome c
VKVALITAGIAFALFQATANAAVDEEWAKGEAKEHGCMNCHNIDTKKVGPAWKDMGAKYKGKTAADLAASVKSKPVHAAVMKKTSDKDLGLMTEWILTLGK